MRYTNPRTHSHEHEYIRHTHFTAIIHSLGPSCRVGAKLQGWGQAAGYQPRPQAGGQGDGHQIWWLRWIGGRPPDMVASCDLSGWPHLTNKQSRTWQRQSHQTYWLGGRKGIRPVKTWGVVGMGSPLVLVGVAPTGTVGVFRLHYPPLAPQKFRTNNDGVLKEWWARPRGRPTCLRKTGGGETQPERSTALCCLWRPVQGWWAAGRLGL